MFKWNSSLSNLIKRFCSDFIFRSLIFIVISIALDIILAVYYYVLAFYSPLSAWMGGLAIWYLLLAVAKCVLFILFIKYKDRQKAYLIEQIVAIFLFSIGFAILLLSAIMYFYHIPSALPNTTLFINSSILATLVFAFLGGKRYRQQSVACSFYRCKKYLSRIEGLFSLILIFQKVIAFFKWNNETVLKSFFICGIATFIYSLILSITLLYLAKKNKFYNINNDISIKE